MKKIEKEKIEKRKPIIFSQISVRYLDKFTAKSFNWRLIIFSLQFARHKSQSLETSNRESTILRQNLCLRLGEIIQSYMGKVLARRKVGPYYGFIEEIISVLMWRKKNPHWWKYASS